MDNSSAQRGQGKSSSTSSVVESKKLNVGFHDNPEEKNGASRSAGCRPTQEMLDFRYQKSKELKRYKRDYEEAAYRCYGPIPCGVVPQTFRERMAEILKNVVQRYEVMSSAQFSKATDNVLWDKNIIDLVAENPATSKLSYRGIAQERVHFIATLALNDVRKLRFNKCKFFLKCLLSFRYFSRRCPSGNLHT